MTNSESTNESITPIKQSLADRLKALKTNQENWKNRINKTNELEINNCYLKKRISIDENIFKKNENDDKIKLNNKSNNMNKSPSTKLADRMLSLEKSAKQWRNRVGDKDNHKFTISGKMESIDYVSRDNNLKFNSTKPKIELIKNNELSNRRSSVQEIINNRKSSILDDETAKRRYSVQDIIQSNRKTSVINQESINKKSSVQELNKTNELKNKLIKEQKIEISKFDTNLDTFFKPVKLEKVVSPIVSPDNDDDDFFKEFNQLDNNLLVIKKDVKIKNRRSPSSKNPLKKIETSDSYSQSIDLPKLSDYQNVNSKNEQIIIKKSNQFNSSKISSTIRKDLDPTAKKGLESKEDFTKVANKLKKSTDSQEHLDSNNLLPNKKLNSKYLIQIKGRKKIQVRLVEPCYESINDGDSFILLTNDEIYVWIGQFSNIIERRKAIEVGNKLYNRKELGFTGGKLITIDNDKKTNLNHNDINTFKNLISSNNDSSLLKFNSAGNEEEDELYENQIIKTNKVYVLDQDNSVFKPYEQMYSKQLYQQYLNPYDAYLFDFNDEIYVWLGFYLSNENRQLAIELTLEYYSKLENKSSYLILYKITQNMEMILFQEKFFDWQLNYKHKTRNLTGDLDKRMNLKLFNVDKMFKKPNEIDFILDQTNIGRGDYYRDENELLYIEIITDNIRCWHVNEYEKKEIKNQELGQFFDTETYVIRWQYRINRLGNLERKKSTDKSIDNLNQKDNNKEENIFKKAERVNFKKHKETLDNNVTGRERFCYFYWQGNNSTIASKGAAALCAVELDKEKGTQIQVYQSEEPPCFLRLFKGNFIIFNNKHHQNLESNEFKNQPTRLFLVKGVFSEEAYLYEVNCDVSSLRSRGCFILVDFKFQIAYLWIGKNSDQNQIKIANKVCENINKHCFSILNKKKSLISQYKFTIQTVKQSFETYEFLKYFNQSNTLNEIKSAVKNLINYNCNEELIIFHLSSLSGEFTFKRLQCTYSSNEQINNFPFEQKQLYYSVTQPAFFLIDTGEVVFLWQGCATKQDELTGSITVRYSQEKKCALETVLSYCHKKYQNKSIEAYLIHAGLEPKQFIHLFPEWKIDEEIKEIQLKDGKKENEMQSISEVLQRVCNLKNDYKLEDLRKKPLPDAINPLIIESYLSDSEFRNVFNMDKDNFYLLPLWKQNKLKQAAGLF